MLSLFGSGWEAELSAAFSVSAFCAASSSARSRLGECLRACAVRYGRLCISVRRLMQRSLEKPRLSSTMSRGSSACRAGQHEADQAVRATQHELTWQRLGSPRGVGAMASWLALTCQQKWL